MDDATLRALTREMDEFLDANPALADLDGDAVEMLMFAELTTAQREWLEEFVVRWMNSAQG